MSNGSEELPLNCIVPFMSSFMFATCILDSHNEAVSPDQIKCLSEISECEGKWHLLPFLLLLELSMGEDHV